MTEMASVASGGITPFWRRIPKFFLYPLRFEPLIYIGGLAAVSILAILGPLFVLVVELAISVTFLRYAFLILGHTAVGHLEPPKRIGDANRSSDNRPYKQFAVFVIFALLTGIAQNLFGRFGGGVVLVLLQIALPASIMLIAISDNVPHAINPLAILEIMLGIGLPYLALCVFLVSLSAGSAWTIAFLGPVVPKWLLLPFFNFVSMYFVLIMYNMMGYALYQNHHAVGIDVKVDFSASAESAHKQVGMDPLTLELNELLSAGNIEGALALLRKAVDKEWERNDLHDRLHKLLQTADKKEEIVSHGKLYIYKLMEEKRLARVLDIYEDCLKADPEFRWAEAAKIYHLASTAHAMHRPKLALAIMKQFEKRNPGHPDIPAVYLLAAKILHEDLRDERAAQALLSQICRKYPDHPQRAKAEEYLEFMRKMASQNLS